MIAHASPSGTPSGSAPEPVLTESDNGRGWAYALLVSIATIYLIDAWVARIAVGRPDIDVLSWAVAVDLVFVVPLLVYLVGVRRLGWPWPVMLPATLLGILASGHWVPATKDGLLADIELLLVPLELAVLGFIAIRTRAAWLQWRRVRGEVPGDLWDSLRQTSREVVGRGRVAEILAYELAVQAYALGSWRRQLPEPSAERFTMDRRSGLGLLMGGMLLATAFEMVPVHFLLDATVSPTVAWIVTLVSLYGGLWIVGHWQAIRHQPIELGEDDLQIRFGLLWRLNMPYDRISSWRVVPPSEARPAGALRAFPGTRASHLLELNEPLIAVGPYGLEKKVDQVAIFIDEPDRFEEALEHRLGR